MVEIIKYAWDVPEEQYREDPALSYSTLATYERGGFNCLSNLYDKKDTPSLRFGSAVDALVTGGREEFDNRFLVADFPDISDAIVNIVKEAFNRYHITYHKIEDIPDEKMIELAIEFNYQNNWKPETRAKVLKEKGSEYYELLHLAENKILLSSKEYEDVQNCVRALKESPATSEIFAPDNPFSDSVKHYYQLKFKTVLSNNISYRCMADLIIVDYDKKIIYPYDLKTSSHKEWDFYKSFIDWNYSIQARLYWRIIRKVMNESEEFKDFSLADYRFVVVNKETLIPLVWWCPFTQQYGTIKLGKREQIELRDPEDIGKELYTYLMEKPQIPAGISYRDNDLEEWLNKL